MKKKDIITAYPILQQAKLSKMDDAEKITVVKAMRQMKPVYESYQDFAKDAQDKLKGDNHEEMTHEAEEWNKKYKGKPAADIPAEDLERLAAINEYFTAYNRRIEKCLKEELEGEAECTHRLTEEAFGRLVASNPDMTVGDIVTLGEIIA